MGYEDLEQGLDAILGAKFLPRRRKGNGDLLPPHEVRKRIRMEAGVAAPRLAHVLGVSAQALYYWEKDRNPGSVELAEQYKHALEGEEKKGGQA